MDAGATLEVRDSLGGALSPPARPLSAVTRSRARWLAVGVLAVLLAPLAAATLVLAGVALFVPPQLDEGEPLIYGLAGRLLAGQPLYQPLDQQPFVQVHYMPLYYALVALLRALGGSGFGPGRALSLGAGLVIAIAVGYLAATRAGRWSAGGFAALLCLALTFPGGPAPFLALERVDVLGVALSVAAIAVLARRTDRPHLIAAGCLAGLALLTKQSLFAAALAGTIWLGLGPTDRRKALLFGLVVGISVLVPVLYFQGTSGGAFWDNVGLANPSPTALAFGEHLFRELVVLQGVPTLLALAFVFASRAWNDARLRLLVMYWLASTISILGIVKVGANHNYWIEFGAANAVLATLGIWRWARGQRRRPIPAVASMLPVWLFAACLAVLTPARFIADRSGSVVPPAWTLDLAFLWGFATDPGWFNGVVDDVRAHRGVVLAESMDVAVLANHPVHFEPFAFSMLEYERRWSSQPLVDDICAGRISLLVLSYPIESDIYPVGLPQFPMWPRSVMTALRQALRFDKIEGNHWFYRPLPAPPAAAIARCQAAAAAAR